MILDKRKHCQQLDMVPSFLPRVRLSTVHQAHLWFEKLPDLFSSL